MVQDLGETATVTSKSMVTIPSSIRRRHKIKEGDKVQFVEVDGTIMMIPVKNLAEMHGMFRNRAKALVEGVRELNREHRKEARE
jgi:AbrB family looped-hinge helix DNA binding protein